MIAHRVAPAPAGAQATAAKSIPRLADGKPDFNGIWDRPRVGDITRDSNACGSGAPTTGCKQTGAGELPYTAWGKEQMTGPRFDYAARCLPWGYTRAMGTAYPLEIIQTPKRLAYLFESNNVFHVIPTDGRKLPTLPVDLPRWWGYSVGHWEGDTLVVETTNYINGFQGSTNNVKLTERFTRVSPEFIHWQITVDDPATWTQPWTFMIRLKKTDGLIYEYACHEGNYAMEGILAGARAEEAKAAKKK